MASSSLLVAMTNVPPVNGTAGATGAGAGADGGACDGAVSDTATAVRDTTPIALIDTTCVLALKSCTALEFGEFNDAVESGQWDIARRVVAKAASAVPAGLCPVYPNLFKALRVQPQLYVVPGSVIIQSKALDDSLAKPTAAEVRANPQAQRALRCLVSYALHTAAEDEGAEAAVQQVDAALSSTLRLPWTLLNSKVAPASDWGHLGPVHRPLPSDPMDVTVIGTTMSTEGFVFAQSLSSTLTALRDTTWHLPQSFILLFTNSVAREPVQVLPVLVRRQVGLHPPFTRTDYENWAKDVTAELVARVAGMCAPTPTSVRCTQPILLLFTWDRTMRIQCTGAVLKALCAAEAKPPKKRALAMWRHRPPGCTTPPPATKATPEQRAKFAEAWERHRFVSACQGLVQSPHSSFVTPSHVAFVGFDRSLSLLERMQETYKAEPVAYEAVHGRQDALRSRFPGLGP